MLKWILHDWDDQRAVQILRNSRRSIVPGGKLLVLEIVLAGANQEPFTKLMDLNMLVMTGGRERTFEDYSALLQQAGYQLNRAYPTESLIRFWKQNPHKLRTAGRPSRIERGSLMNLELTGKKALVTGSTAGIGLAIATTLAREGAAVFVNGRTQARVDEAIKAVRKDVPDATLHGIAADLGTPAGAQQVIGAVPDVEILVNNVGIFEPKAFEEIPDEDWFRFFEVNVMSGVRLSRHYLPRMRAANWGRILFISSESGLQIPAEMIHYGMTKSAQISIARGLAESVTGTGITVNSVLPGPTLSEGVGTFVESLASASGVTREDFEKRFFSEMRGTSLIKRFLDPSEIAAMVAFLASPLSSATNGAAIRVEGGIVKSMA